PELSGSDTTAYLLTITAGSVGADSKFFYNLDYEGQCQGPSIITHNYEVIEICDACAPDDCETRVACGSMDTRVIWNATGCVGCPFEVTMSLERKNFGYTDKTMTTKLTRDDVPGTDLKRFFPGDTMALFMDVEIRDHTVLRAATHFWSFEYRPTNNPNVSGLVDKNTARFVNWYFIDGVSGDTTALGDFDCFRTGQAAALNRQPSTRGEFPGYTFAGMANQDLAACPDIGFFPGFPGTVASYIGSNQDGNDWADQRMTFTVNWEDGGASPDCPTNTDGADTIAQNNNCIEEFMAMFDPQNGDRLLAEMEVNVVSNPALVLGSSPSSNSIQGFFRTNANSPTGCAFRTSDSGLACLTQDAFDVHKPGPVTATPTITINDCSVNEGEVEVEYVFEVSNPVPSDTIGQGPWYANEYRPLIAVEFMQPNFPTSLIYGGDATITDGLGNMIPLGNEYIDSDSSNIVGVDVNGDTCYVAEDPSKLGSVRWLDDDWQRGRDIVMWIDGTDEAGTVVDQSPIFGRSPQCNDNPLIHQPNDPFPFLGVGATNDCSWSLSYSLKTLCPDGISASDFVLEAQFSNKYVTNFMSPSYLSTTSGGGGSHFSNSSRNGGIWMNNPYADVVGGQPFYFAIGPDPLLYPNHWARQELADTA
ncbi:MAG: hypothetical protein AAF242_18260, partial [Bacteroidota bacterium]